MRGVEVREKLSRRTDLALSCVLEALTETLHGIGTGGGVAQALIGFGVVYDGCCLPFHGQQQGELGFLDLLYEVTRSTAESRQRLGFVRAVKHGIVPAEGSCFQNSASVWGLVQLWIVVHPDGLTRDRFMLKGENTMTLEELRTVWKPAILKIAERRGARRLWVFGSVARAQSDGESDIDFLVELEPGRSLFDLGGLGADLEALLHSKVEVVTERGLRPMVRERVLAEALPL